MSKFQQGTYVVMNPAKYAGKGAPKYRSGWELAFMRFCDSNDHILMKLICERRMMKGMIEKKTYCNSQ